MKARQLRAQRLQLTGYSASYSGTPLLNIAYERDGVDRITRKTESTEGGVPVDTYYQYDLAGRLYRAGGWGAGRTLYSIRSERHSPSTVSPL